jgi:uncharacterized protein
VRNFLTDRASEGAIGVFADNLRHILLSPPLKNKAVLGLDPGYRTGVKFAVIDETGKMLEVGVIYPTPPREDIAGSEKKLGELVKNYKVGAIAVGNGTASKETEIFVSDFLGKNPGSVFYFMVSESGASVYSASKAAQNEFPDLDVSLRSAVSIARRLQDPLAELVKIDPKSVGVGQYQHDMEKGKLERTLSNVVEDCVNHVGVDINTASPELLSFVSGINAAVAKSIVAYREKKKKIQSRTEFLDIPRLGVKASSSAPAFCASPSPRIFSTIPPCIPKAIRRRKRFCPYCAIPRKTSGQTACPTSASGFPFAGRNPFRSGPGSGFIPCGILWRNSKTGAGPPGNLKSRFY